MFRDNRSVVTSATLPHSTLSKRHNILAFHRVREAIAAKIIDFHWIQSDCNLSDMLSKHWEHIKIFPMIQKLLITCGPITLIPRSATEEIPKSSKNFTHTTHKVSSHQNVSPTQNSKFQSSTCAHTKLHISTHYFTCQYKNMSHPPQEGSNRSLAYFTLLDVLW